ncbi:CapA family protein [Salinibacillus xinjiangensis]|uniref:CapA family protein n=1 Tax=Salinibacillus xinjiangensis TaxID=1229268 RepID=A0A6G1X304_9BACI|nr:CapA family protein [Salinibacillus xinjiangensis]MRG85280.1 CapA family protein [Salinibacillus xinjiangensis]
MKKWTVPFILFFLFGGTVIGYIVSTQEEANGQTEYTIHNHSTLQDSKISNKTFKTEITLGAIGDILIHDSVYRDARTSDGYDFKDMFTEVKDSMLKQDLMFANQETIIGGTDLGLSSYPQFNSPYDVADALKESGVDIVSMANNHTLDVGEEGILNATDYYKKIGMPYVGAYRSKKDQQKPRILKAEGISVGFLAYTYGTNGLIRPENKPYLVQYIDDNTIIEDIKDLKPQVDFVVVSLHFGLENQRLANDVQKLLADEVSKAGADIIIGHHPHVLQPVNWITQENGHKTLVVYSLGNFLSGQAKLYQRIGGVMQVQLSKTIDENNKSHYNLSNVKVMPTFNYRPDYQNYKIVPLYKANQYGLSDAKSLYDEISDHMKTYTDDIKTVPNL